MAHPVLSPGKVAVVTGGASGIGLAAATRLAERGMKVVLADLAGAKLEQAADVLGRVLDLVVESHDVFPSANSCLDAMKSARRRAVG